MSNGIDTDKLIEWKKLGTEHQAKESGQIILALVDEVVRLKRLAPLPDTGQKKVSYGTEDVYTDDTVMFFGKNKGNRLGSVQDDYLLWWLELNPDRGIIELEVAHGEPKHRNFAKKKLKLFDYLAKRFKSKPIPAHAH